jgi:hypothetical protein
MIQAQRLTRTNWRRNRSARTANFRPLLEALEDRCVPAVDPILEWNAVAIQADRVAHSGGVNNDQPGPTNSSRALAIVHAAMFDAYNSIHQNYTSYLTQAPNSTNASDVAAVAKAARDTLVALYPSQQVSFNAALTQTLSRVPNGARENRGIAVGQFVAQRILQIRANDGASDPMPYTPGTDPGDHNADPFHAGQGFLSPGWGNVTPFAISSPEAIGTRPAPELSSFEYTMAYNQAKALGGNGITTPTQRSAEQTEIGIFWGYDGSPGLGVPPRLYNQIARVIADQQENTVAENARMFALINISMADAGIQCWDVKYRDNFWRPILGIQSGDSDGNPFTDGDAAWKYYGAPRTNPFPGETNFTPNFPAYTSGHATFGAAAFKTLANFYRTQDISFTITSDELNGVSRDQDGSVRPIRPRTFSSLSQAAAENAASRIFLGIHWRFDATEGVRAGNMIADIAFDNFLRPRNGGGPTAIADDSYASQIDGYLNTFGGSTIIDDGDPGFSATDGFFAFSGQGHLNDVHFAHLDSGEQAATWTFGVTPGTYRVSVTWSAHPNRATDAPFTVLDGATALGTVLVNQELDPDDFTSDGASWETLGDFAITGDTLVVLLTNLANEYVVADAVRIERVS